jgi:hypothetical protein
MTVERGRVSGDRFVGRSAGNLPISYLFGEKRHIC